ncbi:HAD family phosphatase [Candidatus Dojkabacteria bacterium]|nr:HAD family phosphatase [Candidatus Dojkabacteria bacterium]
MKPILSKPQIKDYILNSISLEKQLLLSIDIDKTLVDRKKSSHDFPKYIGEELSELIKNKHIVVFSNSGRDFDAVKPVQKNITGLENMIMLNGRAVKRNGNTTVKEAGIIPDSIKNRIWELFINDEIPFLDIKRSEGTLFIVKEKASVLNALGAQKPADWYPDGLPQIINMKEDNNAKDIYDEIRVLRFEVPFKDKNLVNIINEENNEKLYSELINKVIESTEKIEIELVCSESKNTEFVNTLGFVRISVNDTVVNKGLALKEIAEELVIPENNVFHIGDSSGEKADDTVIKVVMPKSNFVVVGNADDEAKRLADVILKPVNEDGIFEFIQCLNEILEGR